VGYEVQLPLRQWEQLGKSGSELSLHIHQVIRDDAWTLYGFAVRAERDLFRELVAVSGVGPQMALGLLGQLSCEELVRAIVQADLRLLCQAPGVGKRTAERLAVELRTRLQEHYSASINGLVFPFTRPVNGPLPEGWNAEAILQGAVDLLASHREWPIPVSRGLNSSGGFSLAFLLESALKGRTGHDRLIKRRILQHLQREGRGAEAFDGLINGHTHIPEATPLALPEPLAEGEGPCHITYYNTGSWARRQRRLGRTALVVAPNGTVGMVRFDRRQGIEPFQPPRFPFNTYPMRPCAGCGIGVAQLEGA